MSPNAYPKRKSYAARPLLAAGVIFLFVGGLYSALPSPIQRAEAFSETGCEGDCGKCHSLTTQDVKSILSKLNNPDAEILGTQMSPIKGLWEVSIDTKGKRSLFYVDFSKTYILPGPIFEIANKANKTQEKLTRLQENRRVEFSRLPLDKALVMGKRGTPFQAAVFTDPDCPYCATLHQEMEKLVNDRKDVAFYIFMFPLQMHKEAYWKSKSIVCNQSLKMLDAAFAHKEIPRTECATKEVDESIKLAANLGITGTPTLVFSNGTVHSGTLTAKQLEEMMVKR